MKQICTHLCVIILLSLHAQAVQAQCTAAITGDSCIQTALTVQHNVNNASNIEWYKDGALYQVRGRYNPVSQVVSSGWPLAEPQDMCGDAQGNLYVVDGVSYSVVKISAGSSTGAIVAGGNGKGSGLNQFYSPKSVAVDAAGNLYVCDALMNRVTKWAPGATEGITVAGSNEGITGNAANLLNGPQNICIDANDNLYIADRWNNRVQKWAPGATSGVTVAGGNGSGTGANQLSEALDVGVDASDNVYVIDYHNNRVQKWTPGATSGITVAGGGGSGNTVNKFSFTTALHVMANGDFYVRDQANYRVQKYTSGATNGITVAGGSGSGDGASQLTWGFGLYVDANEDIFVPSLFLDKVDKFSTSAACDVTQTAYLPGVYYANVLGDCTAQTPNRNILTIPDRPSTIRGPGFVNVGAQRVIYNVVNVPGMVYTWTVPQDATIVRGQGKFGIVVNFTFSSGYITVTGSNGCGQSLIRKKLITVSQPAPSAIHSKSSSVSIFPNPVRTTATVEFETENVSLYHVLIYDLSGRLLLTQKQSSTIGINKVVLNTAGLQQGSYIARIITADGTLLYAQPFIKE